MDGCQNSGEGLLLLAAAAAIGLAQGKSADEVGLLAAFSPFWGISWPFWPCAAGNPSKPM